MWSTLLLNISCTLPRCPPNPKCPTTARCRHLKMICKSTMTLTRQARYSRLVKPCLLKKIAAYSGRLISGESVIICEDMISDLTADSLLPVMSLSYLFQFLDKSALGYTAIMGLRSDLSMTGSQYSWSSGIYYFGYLVASYPVAWLLVRLPVGKTIALSVYVEKHRWIFQR